MAEPEEGVKRVLQIKMRALGEPGQVLALIRSAAPFYRTLGGTSFRVLQNVDDPAAAPGRDRIRGPCRARAQPPESGERPDGAHLPAGLARHSAGSADMDVYEDVTG